MRNFLIVVVVLLAGQAVAHGAQAGLAVIVQPARASVKPSEPLALRLTFRNDSAAAFRLPDTINPAAYPYWVLKLQDVNSGKTFTGVSTLPMGAAPNPGEIQPELMPAGEAKTVSVTFSGFAFFEGTHDFQAARNIYFPQRTRPLADFALPAGIYKVRATIRFREFPSRPDLPQEIKDAIAEIEKHPTPLWKGGEAQTGETQITISNDAVAQTSETIQIARDVARGLLDVLTSVKQDSAFVSPSVHTGLWNELRTLEASSTAVKERDVTDIEAARSAIEAMNNALVAAVARGLEISRRTNETPEARRKAQQLSSRIRQFVAPLP